MAAIPTLYAGIQFRSRIEARWAAMFDALGWRWEYEPFDADGYIPDFVLPGAKSVLVEVKADLTLGELETHTPKIDKALKGVWERDVLIVGATPTLGASSCWMRSSVIGLLGEPVCWGDGDGDVTDRSWAAGVWGHCTCGQWSFIHEYQSYASRICGCYDGGGNIHPHDVEAEVKQLWATACNATAWNPPSPRGTAR